MKSVRRPCCGRKAAVMYNTKSRRIALCGVFAALSVAVLLAGAALGLGTYAAPMVAAFLTIPALTEYGPRWAWTQYAAAAVLGLLLVPEPELSLVYALVLGPYPMLKARLDRLRPALLAWAARLAWFNAAVCVVYLVALRLLAPAVLQDLPAAGLALAALLGLGNLGFVLYDRALGALGRLYRLYRRRLWRNRF